MVARLADLAVRQPPAEPIFKQIPVMEIGSTTLKDRLRHRAVAESQSMAPNEGTTS